MKNADQVSILRLFLFSRSHIMSQINLLISALCFVHLKCTQHFWTVLSPKFKYLVMQNIGLSNLQKQQQIFNRYSCHVSSESTHLIFATSTFPCLSVGWSVGGEISSDLYRLLLCDIENSKYQSLHLKQIH